ncbi:hypothetical protein L873DRAFT_812125 [Choiromyces venosus 120613-1]|uniref:Uncharacterized protein n=1 Tax=Choiromyces venosus 120613-1 TaxID=1336337 RepID=A0A3N4JQ51_9PEZI|nr:hypothetical protein L873DRAFT_812125 [Choiromyces venosus 120613-1]
MVVPQYQACETPIGPGRPSRAKVRTDYRTGVRPGQSPRNRRPSRPRQKTDGLDAWEHWLKDRGDVIRDLGGVIRGTWSQVHNHWSLQETIHHNCRDNWTIDRTLYFRARGGGEFAVFPVCLARN